MKERNLDRSKRNVWHCKAKSWVQRDKRLMEGGTTGLRAGRSAQRTSCKGRKWWLRIPHRPLHLQGKWVSGETSAAARRTVMTA